jgi:hypothetical protein
MDLQEIKREIESLKKDTNTFSKPTEKSLIFGFSQVRLLLTAVVAGLLVYIAKPVYIFNFSVDTTATEDSKKVKRSLSYTRSLIAFMVSFVVLIGLQKVQIYF